MSLLEELEEIGKTPLEKYEKGTADTIEQFYLDFISPRLPDQKVVRQWNKLLRQYVDDPKAVFVVRAYMNRGKSEKIKDDELRRGFLTVSKKGQDDEIRYFFTDNFYAAYFAKMVYDGYCPEYDEFKEMMTNKRFPARFGPSCKTERDRAAYNIKSKDPKISYSGYKIAHIVNAGKHFWFKSKEHSITQLSNECGFSRGSYSDWKWDGTENSYIRCVELSADARKVLVAHFLRFVDPFNYILLPKARYKGNVYNSFIKKDGNLNYDIAEYKPLLTYVHNKFTERYGDDYKEYLTHILLKDEFFDSDSVTGKEVINIEYGCPLPSSTTPCKSAGAGKKIGTTALKHSTKAPSPALSSSLMESMVRSFLIEGKSYRTIESEILVHDTNKSNHGNRARAIIKKLGIPADMKGKLTEHNIADYIKSASSELLPYLEKISMSFSK